MTLHGDELRLCDLKQNGNLERAQRRRDIRLWPSQASQPARPAKDAVCIGRTVQKTANSTTANRRLLDTLFLSTAVHGLVHCPLAHCRHAAVGDVARRFKFAPSSNRDNANSLPCERRRKKKAVLGSAKKAKLDHAPAQPANGLPFLVWSCGHGLAMHAAGVHADETNRHCAFCLSGIVSLTLARFVGNLAARRRRGGSGPVARRRRRTVAATIEKNARC